MICSYRPTRLHKDVQSEMVSQRLPPRSEKGKDLEGYYQLLSQYDAENEMEYVKVEKPKTTYQP